MVASLHCNFDFVWTKLKDLESPKPAPQSPKVQLNVQKNSVSRQNAQEAPKRG